MLPDLLIIGDSHTTALVAGCEAHNLKAETLRFSGNFWHSGHVQFHPQHGVWVRRSKAMQQQVLDVRERLGGRSLVSRDIPILGSMAFNLGRIVPPFGFNRHVTEAGSFLDDPESSYASQALVNAYVEAARRQQILMVRRIARLASLILVVPPKLRVRSNYTTFSNAIAGRLASSGVRLFDPSPTLCRPDEALQAEYLAPDGLHGNREYGSAVIGLLLSEGLIAPRSAD